MRLLDVFKEVTPVEVEAVAALRREIESTLAEASDHRLAHVSGDVVLLRHVRQYADKAAAALRKDLAYRSARGFLAAHANIVARDLGFDELPHKTMRIAAQWAANDFLAVTTHGDIVAFEPWGQLLGADAVKTAFPLQAFRQWMVYRFEWRAMLLDLLSRRSLTVVRCCNVIDCSGVNFAHKQLMPYIRAWLDTPGSGPSLVSQVWFLGANRIVKNMRVFIFLFFFSSAGRQCGNLSCLFLGVKTFIGLISRKKRQGFSTSGAWSALPTSLPQLTLCPSCSTHDPCHPRLEGNWSPPTLRQPLVSGLKTVVWAFRSTEGRPSGSGTEPSNVTRDMPFVRVKTLR